MTTQTQQHTPGPWAVGEPTFYENLRYLPVRAGEYNEIAAVDLFRAAAQADANLIAAAPDLLAALLDLVTGLDMNRITLLGMDEARAAIDKARGNA